MNEPNNSLPEFVDLFELRLVGTALRRHGWVVLLMGVLGVLIGLGFSMMSPPVYRAEAVLLVNIHLMKIDLDRKPIEVEVILPARRLVGTVCESDQAMLLLSERLDGELFSEAGVGESERIGWLRERLYYDQRGLEMAALRAVSPDPDKAALLANAWAAVSRELLRKAYGTTVEDVQEIEALAAGARLEVIKESEAFTALSEDVSEAVRVEREDELDTANRYLWGLNKRSAQLKVRSIDSEQIAKIVSPASPPGESINPSLRLVMGLFGFAGLLLGLAVALLRGRAPGSRVAAS